MHIVLLINKQYIVGEIDYVVIADHVKQHKYYDGIDEI